MNAIIVLLMQARVEATLVIISLLLVSAIIGYVTAWLYFRRKFRNDIQTLESIISQRKHEEVVLNKQISALQKTLSERSNELEKLTIEVKNLRSLAANTPQVSTFPNENNLRMISGIGPFIEERLHAMDIYTYEQISNFTPADIKRMNVAIEYFAGRIERDEWVAQAKELVADEAREAVLDRIRARKTQVYFDRIGIADKLEADDLTLISGIGGWIEKKLNALDIHTFKQISNFNNEDIEVVTEAIEFFPGRIERDEWVHQAKDLVQIEGKKEDLLNRIREKKSAISYTNMGVAHKHRANNLTLINGISLWVEERLNLLDIFTFEQISKFSPDDVKAIAEILDISPSRIHEDNWIGQAKAILQENEKSRAKNIQQ